MNQDKKTLKKINRLIKDAQRDPYGGEGKPEPLSGDMGVFELTLLLYLELYITYV